MTPFGQGHGWAVRASRILWTHILGNAAWPILTSPSAKGDGRSDQDVLARRDSWWHELLFCSTSRSNRHIPSGTLPVSTHLIFPLSESRPAATGSFVSQWIMVSPCGGCNGLLFWKAPIWDNSHAHGQQLTEMAGEMWCLTGGGEGRAHLCL